MSDVVVWFSCHDVIVDVVFFATDLAGLLVCGFVSLCVGDFIVWLCVGDFIVCV